MVWIVVATCHNEYCDCGCGGDGHIVAVIPDDGSMTNELDLLDQAERAKDGEGRKKWDKVHLFIMESGAYLPGGPDNATP